MGLSMLIEVVHEPFGLVLGILLSENEPFIPILMDSKTPQMDIKLSIPIYLVLIILLSENEPFIPIQLVMVIQRMEMMRSHLILLESGILLMESRLSPTTLLENSIQQMEWQPLITTPLDLKTYSLDL